MSTRLPHTSARTRPENLAILLREPFRVGTERLHRRFAERGHPDIRAPHGNVMQFLDDGGTRVSVLAERAQMTKQAMAELVGYLERHGYVVRVPDPTDRRAKLVLPTERGREVVEIAQALVPEVEGRLKEVLGADRLRALGDDLEAIRRVATAQR